MKKTKNRAKPKIKVSKKTGKSKKRKIPKKLTKAEKKAEALDIKERDFLSKGKKRGFVTYDEILKTFPDIEHNILFLDALYEKLSTAGIDVLEGGNFLDLDEIKKEAKPQYGKDVAPSYDSIQMYLKEIGQYPLIYASEEKEFAKRIEKGDKEAKNLLARANLRLVVSTPAAVLT